MRYYNIADYKEKKFNSEEEILDEAKKNKKEAEKIDFENGFLNE